MIMLRNIRFISLEHVECSHWRCNLRTKFNPSYVIITMDVEEKHIPYHPPSHVLSAFV